MTWLVVILVFSAGANGMGLTGDLLAGCLTCTLVINMLVRSHVVSSTRQGTWTQHSPKDCGQSRLMVRLAGDLVAIVCTEDVSHSESLGSKRRDPSSAVAGHLGFSLMEFVRYGKEENYLDREPGKEAIFIAFLTDLVTARFVLPR